MPTSQTKKPSPEDYTPNMAKRRPDGYDPSPKGKNAKPEGKK